MVVAHNMQAANASRMLNITTSSQSKSTEKLSSGYRINRAADDAAGLSISEKMRKQIRGLNRALENAEDGISLVQTADGALEEVHSMLQRANELCVQAANGTNSEKDRADIQEEIAQIKDEIDRIGDTTSFNGQSLFRGDVKKSADADDSTTEAAGNVMADDASPSNYDSAYRITADLSNGTFEVTSLSEVETTTDGVTDSSSALAKKIATEYFPNAIKQITDAVPALAATANFTIDLYLKEVDGAGKVSAYASCAGYSDGAGNYTTTVYSFTVDTDDFSDSDTTSDSARAGYLESTIAHEMTHSLMFAAVPNGMYSASSTAFPLWFKEGAAQLAGGGMNRYQGWSNWLSNITDTLSGENDSSKDSEIATQLVKDTVENNPYGRGYLATAYMSWLAHDNTGSSEINSANIADGFNKILAEFQSGKTLDEAVQSLTGKTLSEVVSAFNSGSDDAVAFARRLAYNSGSGDGSIIASSLSVGGIDILGDTVKPEDISVKIGKVTEMTYVDDDPPIVLTPAANRISFHVGSDADMTNKIMVNLYEMNTVTIGIGNLDVGTEDSATSGITLCGKAIKYVSQIRSYYGAIQNRLEHTVANLDNVVENTEAAESRIRDTDMADEMVNYSKNNILAQAGQAMLAQANSSTQGVLSLLGAA